MHPRPDQELKRKRGMEQRRGRASIPSESLQYVEWLCVVCVTAIHDASVAGAVWSNQHPGERVQLLPGLRQRAAAADVYMCLHWGQVRQQVLADRALLRHLLYTLRLHRNLHFQP